MNIRGFASDNNSGVSPEVLQALAEVNQGHEIGYGDDRYTKEVNQLFRKYFGDTAHPFLVFTGTAANVLNIAAATRSYHAVICAETAHIQQDECGAPEKFTGCKVLPVPTPDGKLTPELVRMHLHGFGFEHHSQPGVISISQSTEMGTVYSPDEIRKLADLAHHYNMLLHMDGARLANAAVSLELPFRVFTTDVGVDLLSFGGTKNGLMAAESVILFHEELVPEFKYWRKQAMQLASKMRFIAAQFIAYLEGDLWERNARHANKMAALLAEKVGTIPGISITQKVQANGVFALIPKEIIPELQREFFFYVWDEHRGEVRWMTSFDTQLEDIEQFASLLRKKTGSQ